MRCLTCPKQVCRLCVPRLCQDSIHVLNVDEHNWTPYQPKKPSKPASKNSKAKKSGGPPVKRARIAASSDSNDGTSVTSPERKYEKMKNPAIKELLKERHLKRGGNKYELIMRLVAYDVEHGIEHEAVDGNDASEKLLDDAHTNTKSLTQSDDVSSGSMVPFPKAPTGPLTTASSSGSLAPLPKTKAETSLKRKSQANETVAKILQNVQLSDYDSDDDVLIRQPKRIKLAQEKARATGVINNDKISEGSKTVTASAESTPAPITKEVTKSAPTTVMSAKARGKLPASNQTSIYKPAFDNIPSTAYVGPNKSRGMAYVNAMRAVQKPAPAPSTARPERTPEEKATIWKKEWQKNYTSRVAISMENEEKRKKYADELTEMWVEHY